MGTHGGVHMTCGRTTFEDCLSVETEDDSSVSSDDDMDQDLIDYENEEESDLYGNQMLY